MMSSILSYTLKQALAYHIQGKHNMHLYLKKILQFS